MECVIEKSVIMTPHYALLRSCKRLPPNQTSKHFSRAPLALDVIWTGASCVSGPISLGTIGHGVHLQRL